MPRRRSSWKASCNDAWKTRTVSIAASAWQDTGPERAGEVRSAHGLATDRLCQLRVAPRPQIRQILQDVGLARTVQREGDLSQSMFRLEERAGTPRVEHPAKRSPSSTQPPGSAGQCCPQGRVGGPPCQGRRCRNRAAIEVARRPRRNTTMTLTIYPRQHGGPRARRAQDLRHGLRGRQRPRRRQGSDGRRPVHRHHGPVGLGQVDPDAPSGIRGQSATVRRTRSALTCHSRAAAAAS
jgi:hypothetical protein